jgi:uncharacterized phage protein (TIGR02218 family)
MTYAASEASIQDGTPVYKFYFVTGSSEYRYTSASYFISDSDGTWTPAPITASNIQQSNEISKNGIRISLPRTNTLAQLFLGSVPEETMSVTIYRAHDPSDFSAAQVYWRGRVASSKASGDTVEIDCEDIFTSMRRPGNRARYQKGCRHALYSTACGVDPLDHDIEGTITAASGFTVTVTGLGSIADDHLVGGIIQLASGVRRSITGQSGTVLTLYRPFNDLVIGAGVSATVFPGCKHNPSDCLTKFSNIENYGGFPYIPDKNPFANSVNGSIA